MNAYCYSPHIVCVTHGMNRRPSLHELTTHVDVGVDWLRLGVQLELDRKNLQAIEQERRHSADELQQMYSLWLTSKPGATRQQLLNALRTIGAVTLAEKYLKWIKTSTEQHPPVSGERIHRRSCPCKSMIHK